MSKWEMVRLGDVCKFLSGYAFDSKLFTDCTENMPLIRIRDVKRGYTKTYTAENYDAKYLIKKGDILIGMDGEFNLGKWNSETALLNQRVCKVIGTDFIDVEFLKYALIKQLQKIEEETSFVTVKHLSIKGLENIILTLPSLSAQKEIAAELDKISDLIAKRKQQIEKLDLLVKAKFIEMFGDPVTNPMGWGTMQMSEVAPAKQAKKSMQGKVWLLNLDVIESNSGNVVELNFVDATKISSSTVQFDDTNVLYSKLRPYLNKVVAPNQEGFATSELVPLKPNDRLLNRTYLLEYLRSEAFVCLISEKVSGAKMPRVVMNEFWKTNVPMPPLNIQNQFADYVQTIEQTKAKMQAGLAELETLYKERMQYYFE